jgi:hypothetical protein
LGESDLELTSLSRASEIATRAILV